MLKSTNEIMSKYFTVLSEYRKGKCGEILEYLQNNEQVSGVLLGGSISYKEDIKKSDVDLFCLLNQVEIFEYEFKNNLNTLSDVNAIIYQGSFPWTEKLYTIFFNDDIDFSIDISLINLKNAETFFWEPNGFILFDKQGTIAKCKNSQISKPDFTRQPFLKSNPFSLAVITLKKIEKNLSRGHLWNALEQLNILRRYIMQIIRVNVLWDNSFLGRVDRDIEEVIPSEMNYKLSQTTAVYDKNDIAIKAVLLIEIFTNLTEHLKDSNEKDMQDWIIKQLKHEKNKLICYYNI